MLHVAIGDPNSRNQTFIVIQMNTEVLLRVGTTAEVDEEAGKFFNKARELSHLQADTLLTLANLTENTLPI